MLLVRNVYIFLYFFSVKIRLEIMFIKVPNKKETFFGHTKFNLSKSQKLHFLHAFGQKMSFFSLFLVKIWLEIMFNNVLDRKKTIFALKNSIFQCHKNWFFLKGLTHAFGQKCNFFLYLFSVKIRLEIMFNNVLYRKETFFSHKKI